MLCARLPVVGWRSSLYLSDSLYAIWNRRHDSCMVGRMTVLLAVRMPNVLLVGCVSQEVVDVSRRVEVRCIS